jgi:hypothetical protein
MQVKLSELRKIIREELNKDYANFLYEQAEKDSSGKENKDETVDWTPPEMESESVNESEHEDPNESISEDDSADDDKDDKKNEIWPAVARVAGQVGAGMIADKLFENEEEENEEEENESNVKEDSHSKHETINESMNFDRFSRLWK